MRCSSSYHTQANKKGEGIPSPVAPRGEHANAPLRPQAVGSQDRRTLKMTESIGWVICIIVLDLMGAGFRKE